MFVIYQIFTRTFSNKNTSCIENGSIETNGVGKMNDFTPKVLNKIKKGGFTHVWFTGVIRHATTTDYSAFGIPKQHTQVVKGKAGSPYAITDYYDIDPDIAEDITHRMEEFEALIERTHKQELKVIIDFVPNHVAREYKSITAPECVNDLGADDDVNKHFDPQNNFYYCPQTVLDLSDIISPTNIEPYTEYPAKCTGNDHFDAKPSNNDWYETVKLNYGIDYCDLGGRSEHFTPIPSTWLKMTDILLFWAAKGIDGFRCDMAEMVPAAFWKYATAKVKEHFPNVIFIGEVYAPNQYRNYLAAGFNYLYDKVGMYDCLRDVMCGYRPASDITSAWQSVDDIHDHMLNFLENHDEQRIASDFFAGDAKKGIPALMVAALFQSNPMMIYAGQEFGEKGMAKEGFSGIDGRSTIFDYWNTPTVMKAFYNIGRLSPQQRYIRDTYYKILRLCNEETAISEGLTYDLMYANFDKLTFDTSKLFAFMRKKDKDLLLIVANFDKEAQEVSVTIPEHAIEFLRIRQNFYLMTDLLTGESIDAVISPNGEIKMSVSGYNGRIWKITM
ncbi:alpha-amylase [Prevotella bivia DNF00320]|uniref:Alpha-amylase n=1 Tax=Prevotella bivia DNF00320 TaxID=1401068 RepID=A0A096AAP3_9BACT|nr:alpha-amylase family glycosyl hydrolase [Prevotella bivia]KGF44173.1 alpha-amylase [Prevotella bivia DNF00320]MDU3908952.1 alpha-amylase family glycosyl hydrolase [Prevotella bivia]